MGSRFPLSNLARRFRTDVQILFCRRIRGGPSVRERAVALDRIAGSLCLVFMTGATLWLANQTLPATTPRIPLIGESAQAAPADPESEVPATEGSAETPTSADIRALQSKLKMLGFDPGPVDGIAGPRTLSALNLYRASIKLDRVSHIDRTTIANLTD
ncbi:peptidoglycan-binding domain-containing protein [Dongia deserti]|uniref:peptidoglycan-binding domain-containing protein n=1 Tax=Dongia deserti TaxID=2268030 RepID=UPI000E646A1D|nr:peptidoglycan-binding domain-containing protein [Dongia deserti]